MAQLLCNTKLVNNKIKQIYAINVFLFACCLEDLVFFFFFKKKCFCVSEPYITFMQLPFMQIADLNLRVFIQWTALKQATEDDHPALTHLRAHLPFYFILFFLCLYMNTNSLQNHLQSIKGWMWVMGGLQSASSQLWSLQHNM